MKKFFTLVALALTSASMMAQEEVYQIPNSNFEDFHKALYNNGENTSDEPNYWHSFMSCTGAMSEGFFGGFTKNTVHTFIEENDLRPGTTGKQCVKIVSLNAIITSANGTLTTGRLNAGSSTPSDLSNHSFLDLSSTDVDDHGDPFSTRLTGRPDSIKFWVKYHVGERTAANKNNIYATASAAITDGTYYQDPEDKEYTNVVARAINNQIASNEDAWQEISIPFIYTNNPVEPKAILVTLSTCAVPGGGSMNSNNPDILYVDDLSLVYNSNIASVKYKDATIDLTQESPELTVNSEFSLEDFKVESDGKGAVITKQWAPGEEGTGTYKVIITATANDHSTSHSVTITVKGGTPAGINDVTTTLPSSGIKAIYTLSGQQVSTMQSGHAYIVKETNGKTYKVIKK